MDRITDPTKLKVAAAYNSASDHFDDTPLAFWDRYGRRTVDRLSLSPGDVVLDVACGTGASALPAAEVVGPKGRVIAVDLAERLLEIGRAKAEQRDLKNIEFTYGDMTALPFPDSYFDAVICVFGIFFVADMAKQVGELWRMVRPGGQLAVTTWGPHWCAPLYEVWRRAVRAVRPDLYNPVNPWDRVTEPEALAELMKNGGVPNARITAESGSQALRSPEDWWTLILGNGTRGTMDAMDPKEAAQVRAGNLRWARDNNITSVETNVIYATASKGALATS